MRRFELIASLYSAFYAYECYENMVGLLAASSQLLVLIFPLSYSAEGCFA